MQGQQQRKQTRGTQAHYAPGAIVDGLLKLISRERSMRNLTLKSMMTLFHKEVWNRFTIPLVYLDSAGLPCKVRLADLKYGIHYSVDSPDLIAHKYRSRSHRVSCGMHSPLLQTEQGEESLGGLEMFTI